MNNLFRHTCTWRKCRCCEPRSGEAILSLGRDCFVASFFDCATLRSERRLLAHSPDALSGMTEGGEI